MSITSFDKLKMKNKKNSSVPPRDDHSLWMLPQPLDFREDHGWLYKPSPENEGALFESGQTKEPTTKDSGKTSSVTSSASSRFSALKRKRNRARTIKSTNLEQIYRPPDETFLRFLGEWKNKRPSILHLHPVSDVELMAYGHWLGERDLVIDVEPVDDRLYDFVWVRPATGSTYDRWKDDVERAVRACKAGGALWVGKGSGMDDNALLGPIQALLEGEKGVSMEVVSSSDLGWGFM